MKQIRTTKNPDYWVNLSSKEKKTFNHWLILVGLSQDIRLTETCAFLWRDGYYDKIPSPIFYKLLCDLIPKTNEKFPWIKAKKKNYILLRYISKWYSISNREANEYLTIFMNNDVGMKELANILEGSGLSDEEAEKVFIGEEVE